VIGLIRINAMNTPSLPKHRQGVKLINGEKNQKLANDVIVNSMT